MEIEEEKKNKSSAVSKIIIVFVILAVVSAIVALVIKAPTLPGASSGVGNLTNEQLKETIAGLFSGGGGGGSSGGGGVGGGGGGGGGGSLPSQDPIIIYPPGDTLPIEPNETGGVGIGIINNDTNGTGVFSYTVSVFDLPDCGITEEEAQSWIISGGEETNIILDSGEIMTSTIIFSIPPGALECTIRYRIDVQKDGAYYATDFFTIQII
jgi:hypothetical protein